MTALPKPLATVVIPVGPLTHHQQFLRDCLDSVASQTVRVDIMLVSDMAELPEWLDVIRGDDLGVARVAGNVVNCWVHENAWRLGVSASYNIGVAQAFTECCFLLGADDTLEAHCIERCMESYERSGQHPGPYIVPVRYMNGEREGFIQYDPCNAMMVTKRLWRATGGFPIEAFTASDSMWHSMQLGTVGWDHYQRVSGGQFEHEWLYNYRVGAKTDTAMHGESQWQTAIFAVRDQLTSEALARWAEAKLWSSQVDD
jgi:hypothetical protein